MADTPFKKAERIRVLFDATRLLNRSASPTPTGIDRVDLAYLRALQSEQAVDLRIVVFDRFGACALPQSEARELTHRLIRHWATPLPARSATHLSPLQGFLASAPETPPPAHLQHFPATRSRSSRISGRTIRWLRRPFDGARLRRWMGDKAELPTVYVNTSHGHLYRAASAQWLSRSEVGKVFMIHDLIPIEFPQYNRASEPDRHRARIAAVAACAAHVLTNSAATRDSLTRYLRGRGDRIPPITAVHLGIEAPVASPETPPAATSAVPYFVCVGTLEPRKNHHLLLDAWESMLGANEGPVPRLVLIGRRGWTNQALFNRLDRNPVFRRHVIEYPGLDDAEMSTTLRGACALLSPSHAEGFGLPVIEALASRTPALVSDIAAHREVGREFAEYLPPNATREWIRAIQDYAAPGSERRRLRCESLAGYRASSWATHFETVFPLLFNAAAGEDALDLRRR